MKKKMSVIAAALMGAALSLNSGLASAIPG
jgi:hypothetical protein